MPTSNPGCSNGNCVVNDHPKGKVVTHGWCQCLRSLPDETRLRVEAKLHQLRTAEALIKSMEDMPGLALMLETYWEHRSSKL
jgi:hypothetical protein